MTHSHFELTILITQSHLKHGNSTRPLCKRCRTLFGTQRNELGFAVCFCLFYWVSRSIQHPLLEALANLGWVFQSSQELPYVSLAVATGQIHQRNVSSTRTVNDLDPRRFRRFLGPAHHACCRHIYIYTEYNYMYIFIFCVNIYI